MNFVFGLAGSALMYELCKVHKMIVGQEKCVKSMEKMYNTIKQCPHCSRALHELSEDCVMMNNLTKDSAYNSEACGNQENPNQTFADQTWDDKTSENQTCGSENYFEPNSTSTPMKNSTCILKGKITKNPFLNYCRENRSKRPGQQQKMLIKESAYKWKHFSKCDKMNYSFNAVNLREKSQLNKSAPTACCNMTN